MQYGRSFMFVFFFFSSRRRHTRYWRDWSSDVCSSDLRWAIGVFAVFFSAYDAAAGIATGYALRNAQGLSAEGQAAVYEAVKDMPELSLIFGLSIVGIGAWVVALIAAAIALRRAGAFRGPFILLILAGVLLMGGHPFPAGTLAFGCFFVAAAWLELAPGRLTQASGPSRV